MTPTHANKKGVRYRYYVSHAVLQGQASQAGSVARILAPDVEALIVNRLRASRDAGDDASEREIIENHLSRAIVCRDQITITL
jgi:site-specific DNA recombinase